MRRVLLRVPHDPASYVLNDLPRPARLLGLPHKGHLGPGAEADVTIYARSADLAQMFSSPRYVVKGGRVIVEEGQLRRAPKGRPDGLPRGCGLTLRDETPWANNGPAPGMHASNAISSRRVINWTTPWQPGPAPT